MASRTMKHSGAHADRRTHHGPPGRDLDGLHAAIARAGFAGEPECQSAFKFDPRSASNFGSDSNLMQSLIRVALPLSAEESHGEAALRRLVRPQSWGRRRRVGCEDRGRVRNATLDATP